MTLTLNRYLVEIIVPEDVWAARVDGAPPVGWDALPPGKVSIDFGDGWLRSTASKLCTVLSVVVPDELCVLISPAHSHATRIKSTKVKKVVYDSRLF